MGRVAQTPLAAIGLLTPAPRSAATTAHRPCASVGLPSRAVVASPVVKVPGRTFVDMGKDETTAVFR